MSYHDMIWHDPVGRIGRFLAPPGIVVTTMHFGTTWWLIIDFCHLPCSCYVAIFTLSLTPSASEKQCSRFYDDAIFIRSDVFTMFLRFTEQRLRLFLIVVNHRLLYLLLRWSKFHARAFMYKFVKHSYSETRGHLIGSLLIIILDFKGPDT